MISRRGAELAEKNSISKISASSAPLRETCLPHFFKPTEAQQRLIDLYTAWEKPDPVFFPTAFTTLGLFAEELFRTPSL